MPGEDSAWKEILEKYFRQFLAFFFPAVHREIDWSKPLEFLDKEFEGLFPDLDTGGIRVDKLVKATLKSGSEQWLLAHVEVQGRPEEHFDRRILRYNIRIGIRYERDVLSLAVLTDLSPTFRPGRYHLELAGMDLTFRFPTVKILDYANRREWLEKSTNPFALVVLAHLDAPKAKDDQQRYDLKFRLTRLLYNRGYTGENIHRLFRFLDWILRLPEEVDIEFHERVRSEIKGKRAMPYIAQYEQRAIDKGREQGRQEGRELGRAEAAADGLRQGARIALKVRFPDQAADLVPGLEAIQDPNRLQAVLDALDRAASLDEIKAMIEAP